MAKKKKKDVEENIENKEEFNDIDENFGLPDLDLEPLDDSSEDPTEEPVEEDVQEEEVVEEVQESQEVVEEEPLVSEDSNNEEEQVEELYVAPEVAPQVAEEPVNEKENNGEETETEEKSAYVAGSYAAKAREQESNSGKIVGIIVVILIMGAVAWYFVYYRPVQVAAEEAKQEQIAADKAKKEQDRIAKEKADEEEKQREEEARLQAIEDAKPKIGTIEAISERTSRYYVVVTSGLDGDLAMDYAKKEVNNGTNIKLLSPLGTNKFYRVTVADHDTWAAAENAANDLKSTFGEDIWVLKY